ncbi:MAG: hypothetical protein HW421_1761 [Ignavibacteria bacterium]|nr:hypothetical protein [Ignavibacteria bacterium]
MKNFRSLLLMTAILLLGRIPAAYSQGVQINFPEYGSVNITKDPEVQVAITNNYHIDTSSIPFNVIRDSTVYDSTNSRLFRAQIDFFPMSLYNQTDSSLYIAKILGGRGYSTIDDSAHFKFQSNQYLLYNETYGISIKGLRIFDPSTQDTIIIDTLITNLFTTQLPPIGITGNTINKVGGVFCNDTILLTFNIPLLNFDIENNKLFTIDSVEFSIDDTGKVITTHYEIDGNYFISSDSLNYGFIPTNPFTPNKDYGMSLTFSNYTADTLYDKYESFSVRSVAKVNVLSQLLGNGILPSSCRPLGGNKMYYITSGENWTFEVPQIKDGYYFYGWFCPEYPNSIGNDSLSRLNINLDCNELFDRNIIAQFKIIPMDTIKTFACLNGSGDTIGRVKVYDFIDSLGDGKYTVPAFGRPTTRVCIEMNTGEVFSYWESNDQTINNSTQTCISVNNENSINRSYTGRGINFRPHGSVTAVDCPTIQLHVKIKWDDVEEEGGIDPPADVATLLDGAINIIFNNETYYPDLIQDQSNSKEANAVQELSSGNNQYQIELKVNMKEQYEIIKWYVSKDGSGAGGVRSPHGQIGKNLDANCNLNYKQDDNCNAYIVVLVRKAKRYLKVQRITEDLSQLPTENTAWITVTKPDYTTIFYSFWGPEDHTTWDEREYEIVYGSQIRIEPHIKANAPYDYDEWVCQDGSLNFTCGPTDDSPHLRALKLTMNSGSYNPITVRYSFKTGFKLIGIMVQNPDTLGQWINYSLIDNNVPMGDIVVGLNTYTVYRLNRMPEMFKTATIKFIFDRTVDLSTFYNKYFVFDSKLQEYNPTTNPVITVRPDGESLTSYPFRQGVNVDVEDNGNCENCKVTLTLKNSQNLETCHYNKLKFELANNINSIRSSTGEPLIRSYNFTLMTALPEFKMTAYRLYVDENMDSWPWTNEEFLSFWGGAANMVTQRNKVDIYIPGAQQKVGFRIANTGVYDSPDDHNWDNSGDFYNKYMSLKITSPSIYINCGWNAIDEDLGDAVDTIAEILSRLEQRIDTTILKDYPIGQTLLAIAIEFMKHWSDDDDNIGCAQDDFMLSKNFWACNRLYRVQDYGIRCKNARMDFKILLY